MVQVSVIIPTYNRTRWLAQALESAINQMSCSVEVIVVDDGSNNSTAREIAASYPQVVYIYQKNQGLGGARNTGLFYSQSEYIQFLDDDDLLVKDSIAVKKDVLDRHQNVDVVYSDLYLMTEDEKIFNTFYQGWKRPLPQGDIYQRLLFYNFIPVHAMLWRREPLVKIGGFPKRSMLEDWECLLQLSERSRFEYIDQPLGYYRLHQDNMSANYKQQTAAYAETQQKVFASERFEKLPNGLKARVLTKYALKQWVDGDPVLGNKFLQAAKVYAPYHAMPWMLSGVMMFGRPLTRRMVRLGWYLRSKLARSTSSRDYFLLKS